MFLLDLGLDTLGGEPAGLIVPLSITGYVSAPWTQFIQDLFIYKT